MNIRKEFIIAGACAVVAVAAGIAKWRFMSKVIKSTATKPVEPTEPLEVRMKRCQRELAQQYFDDSYGSIERVGTYNSNWLDEAGNLTGIFSSPYGVFITPGHQMKMIDPEGRRIIVTGTPLGLAVVRQGSAESDGFFDIYVSDGLLDACIPGTFGSDSQKLSTILGHTEPPVPNIGISIKMVLSASDKVIAQYQKAQHQKES